jgi:hypothetical protein
MIKLVSKKEELKTALMVGSRVTFIGNLPGGQWDNYSGWSKVGSMFGTITKINKVNALVEDKNEDVYSVSFDKLTHINDLF